MIYRKGFMLPSLTNLASMTVAG